MTRIPAPIRVYHCEHTKVSIEIEILFDHPEMDWFEEGPPKRILRDIVRISFVGDGVLLSRLEWGLHFVRDHGSRVRRVILSNLITIVGDCDECRDRDECRLPNLQWNRWIDEAKRRTNA